MQTLRERVKAGARALGISDAELAKRVDMNRTYLSRVLTGERPGTKHLAKIAKELGATTTWLASGRGQAPEWAGVIGEPSPAAAVIPPLSLAVAHLDAAIRLLEHSPERREIQKNLIDLLAKLSGGINKDT